VITVASVFQEHIRIGVGRGELTIPGHGRYTDSNLDRRSWWRGFRAWSTGGTRINWEMVELTPTSRSIATDLWRDSAIATGRSSPRPR